MTNFFYILIVLLNEDHYNIQIIYDSWKFNLQNDYIKGEERLNLICHYDMSQESQM